MPRICSVCVHPMREYIEEELIRNTPLRNIAKQFGTSVTALHRHKQSHLPEHLTQAKQAEEVANASSLLEKVQHLHEKAIGILASAEQANDLRTALMAIREARATLELIAKVTGELTQQVAVKNDSPIVVVYDWQ